MKPERRWRHLGSWSLETALALVVAGAVFWLWPRLGLPRLGCEEVWFGLGWLVMLALPSLLHLWGLSEPHTPLPQTLRAQVCQHLSFALGGVFLLLLLAGRGLGNYKLWLGIVYLAALTLRVLGLALLLRAHLLNRPGRQRTYALGVGGLTFLACLLTLPWVRPDLVAAWPPPLETMGYLALKALLWAGVASSVFLLVGGAHGSPRLAWFLFLGVGLGAGPALAMTWFAVLPLAACLAVLAGMAILRRLYLKDAEPTPPLRPMPLYWLLRALMVLWWGCGIVVTLAAAWWRPELEQLFLQSIWLRAVALGAFLMVCVPVLAEYSLPLLGKSEMVRLGGERKYAGMALSALALMVALAPLLLARPRQPHPPREFFDRARVELVKRPLTLDQKHPQVSLKVPGWLEGVSHVFMVGYLESGAAVPQGETVALLVAEDQRRMPYIYSLRAGIDTADFALARRSVAARARHRPAQVAALKVVYTPSGEAFQGREYYTGLYLGRTVERLSEVRLRLIYHPAEGQAQPRLVVSRIFVY